MKNELCSDQCVSFYADPFQVLQESNYVQEKIQQQMQKTQTEVSKASQQKQRESSKNQISPKIYKKVTYEIKLKLFDYVLEQGFKIKDASKLLFMNYPSAKMIIYKYRMKKRYPQISATKQCSFKSVSNPNEIILRLVTKMGQHQSITKQYNSINQ